MPTYEYRCEKCEHEFEREQRISDPPIKTCPACRSRKVKKLISRTSFVLKGGGWYSDLYSSSSSTSDGSSSSAASASGGESSDAKSDDTKTTKTTKSQKADKPGKSGSAGKKSDSKSAA